MSKINFWLFLGLVPLAFSSAWGAPRIASLSAIHERREIAIQIAETAANLPTGVHSYSGPLPQFLYHWLSAASLERMTQNMSSGQMMGLKNIWTPEYQSIAGRTFPELRSMQGLFSWSNPIAGFVGGTNEVYGRNERLLALEVRPESRAGLLVYHSQPNQNGAEPPPLENNQIRERFDVLYHAQVTTINNTNFIYFKEWIIINPEAISHLERDQRIVFNQHFEPERKRIKKALNDERYSLVSAESHVEYMGETGPAYDETQVKNLRHRFVNANGGFRTLRCEDLLASPKNTPI